MVPDDEDECSLLEVQKELEDYSDGDSLGNVTLEEKEDMIEQRRNEHLQIYMNR